MTWDGRNNVGRQGARRQHGFPYYLQPGVVLGMLCFWFRFGGGGRH